MVVMVMMIIWFCKALFEIKEKPDFSLATQDALSSLFAKCENHLWSLEWGSLSNEVTLLHSYWCSKVSISTKNSTAHCRSHFFHQSDDASSPQWRKILNFIPLLQRCVWLKSQWSTSLKICTVPVHLLIRGNSHISRIQTSYYSSRQSVQLPTPHKARCTTLVNFILVLMPGLLHIWTCCKNLKTMKIACIKLVAFWILSGSLMLISPFPFSRYYWRIQLWLSYWKTELSI